MRNKEGKAASFAPGDRYIGCAISLLGASEKKITGTGKTRYNAGKADIHPKMNVFEIIVTALALVILSPVMIIISPLILLITIGLILIYHKQSGLRRTRFNSSNFWTIIRNAKESRDKNRHSVKSESATGSTLQVKVDQLDRTRFQKTRIKPLFIKSWQILADGSEMN